MVQHVFWSNTGTHIKPLKHNINIYNKAPIIQESINVNHEEEGRYEGNKDQNKEGGMW